MAYIVRGVHCRIWRHAADIAHCGLFQWKSVVVRPGSPADPLGSNQFGKVFHGLILYTADNGTNIRGHKLIQLDLPEYAADPWWTKFATYCTY